MTVKLNESAIFCDNQSGYLNLTVSTGRGFKYSELSEKQFQMTSSGQPSFNFPLSKAFRVFIIGLILGLGWSLSVTDFVFFHSVFEILSVIIGLSIFMVGWNTRSDLKFNYLFILGILYACIAVVDLLHTVTYPGVNLFSGIKFNTSVQLWLLARYLESVGLAWLLIFGLHRRDSVKPSILIVAITITGLFYILFLNVLPEAYSAEGSELSNFKVASEFIIICFLLIAIFGIIRSEKVGIKKQKNLFVLSLVLTIFAELCFTQYTTTDEAIITLGHSLKLLSFYVLYKAVIQHDYLKHHGIVTLINIKPFVVSSLIAVAVLSASYVVYSYELKAHIEQDANHASIRIKDLSATLSLAMLSQLNLTNSLKAFVESNKSFSENEFDVFANLLEESHHGVMSLQLAPEGVVKYVTNIERNSAAIGHDLFGDEKRKKLALKAVREQEFIIVGPVTLVQGGQAIIARQPIYNSMKIRDESTFWGFATVLIDIDLLLRESLVDSILDEYIIAIRGKNALGEQGDVFYGDPEVFESAIAKENVRLPSGSWQIAFKMRDDADHLGIIFTSWYWFAMIVVTVLSGIVSYAIINRPYELNIKIERATKKLRSEIKKRSAAEKRVRYMAEHDALTGLPNRLLFNELAYSALKQAKRKKTNIALYFLDVDGFKPVNDTYGHDVGDKLLKQISQRLILSVREADIVARIGGDEFVVLLLDSDGSQINIAEKIIDQISRTFEIQGHEISVGISIGISRFPVNGDDLASLVKSADAAMYAAKRTGRNNYKIAAT